MITSGSPRGESLLSTQAKLLTNSVLEAIAASNTPPITEVHEIEQPPAIDKQTMTIFDGEDHEGFYAFHFPRERFMSFTRVVPKHHVGDILYLLEKKQDGTTEDPIKVVVIAVIESINSPLYDVALYLPDQDMCSSYGTRMFNEDELYIALAAVKKKTCHLRVVK